jgi:hypothetical protein
MGAVLTGFGGWLLSKFGSELFKRATIFITMNIVLQFLSQWIMSQVVSGISLSSGGGTLTSLFSSIGGMVLYLFDTLWVIPGVFLVLNVKLWRLAGRMTVKAATTGG